MTRRLLLSVFILVVLSGKTFGQVYAVPGINALWNSPSTWIGGVIPSSGDSVIIPLSSAILIINYTSTISSLTVHGHLEIIDASSSLHILHSFVNTGNTTNDGHVFIEDNFTNSGWVYGTGTGAFCISDSTINTGSMDGSFDFCDLSPQPNPPYIDINTGTFSTGISFCMAGLCSPASVNETEHNGTLNVFINANAQSLIVTYPNASRQGILHVFDVLGREVFTRETGNEKTTTLSTGSFPTGIYSVVFHSGNGKLSRIVYLYNR